MQQCVCGRMCSENKSRKLSISEDKCVPTEVSGGQKEKAQ